MIYKRENCWHMDVMVDGVRPREAQAMGQKRLLFQ